MNHVHDLELALVQLQTKAPALQGITTKFRIYLNPAK